MTRYLILVMFLYTLPAWSQSLVLESITLDDEDRSFFAEDIISATSSDKPVLIIGTSRVEFQAVNRISMGPGFSTSDLKGEARFHAYIGNETNSIEKRYERSTSLLLAPNPNDGNFVLSVQNERIQQLMVMDVLGREVYERKNISSFREELHLENLPEGIYFVKVLTDKDSYVSKVKMK